MSQAKYLIKLLSEKKAQHNDCSFYSVSHTLLVPVGTIITRATNKSKAAVGCEDDDGLRVIFQGGLGSGP